MSKKNDHLPIQNPYIKRKQGDNLEAPKGIGTHNESTFGNPYKRNFSSTIVNPYSKPKKIPNASIQVQVSSLNGNNVQAANTGYPKVVNPPISVSSTSTNRPVNNTSSTFPSKGSTDAVNHYKLASNNPYTSQKCISRMKEQSVNENKSIKGQNSSGSNAEIATKKAEMNPYKTSKYPTSSSIPVKSEIQSFNSNTLPKSNHVQNSKERCSKSIEAMTATSQKHSVAMKSEATIVTQKPTTAYQTTKISTDTNVAPLAVTESQAKATSASTATTSASSATIIATTKSRKFPLPKELAYDEKRTKPVDDEYRMKLIKAACLNDTLSNGWVLLKHQKMGIVRALQMRRLILAYDMGLGKTLIGCVYAKAFKDTFPNLKIHVIAPTSLKKEWMRTASIVGLKCEEEKKGTAFDPKCLDLRVSSWARVPSRIPDTVENFILIADEAHNLQSLESARTKDTMKLALSNKCCGCLLLSGTPMKNGKPANLFPLLKAVQHPFGDNQKAYEFFFCNGQNKRYNGREVWDASGSSNLPVLNEHISSHILYKTKDDCLKELPEKNREIKTVPIGSKFEIQHNRALNELANIYKSRDSVGDDALLGAFARLRQVAAFAKVDATVSLTEQVLEEESSVVIFTYFVDAAKQIQKQLKAAGWESELLEGSTPSAKRQTFVDRFQKGITPVFIGTYGSAGVGITLTAARTIILMDRPWTAAETLQAEDRVRRIGQTKTVRSIWMTAFDIDEQIDKLIEHKNENSNSVIDKKASSRNESKAAPRISIRQLVRKILETENSI